jgi:ribosomal protein S18 acetylase RimI-like enzyme
MRGLHQNERMLFDKTADWSDIEESYMKHIIEMQQESDGTFLMAYYDEKPAGFIFGYLDEQDESNIEDYTGLELYVSDGFVLPEYRRQGIYKELNALLEKIYIEKGVKKMTRFTLVNNKPMQKFLEGQGYMPTRFLYEKWLADDKKS